MEYNTKEKKRKMLAFSSFLASKSNNLPQNHQHFAPSHDAVTPTYRNSAYDLKYSFYISTGKNWNCLAEWKKLVLMDAS